MIDAFRLSNTAYSAVFVAADEHTAVDIAAQLAQERSMTIWSPARVLVTADDPDRPIHLETHFAKEPAGADVVTKGAIVDIVMLAECSVIIGTCLSQFSRLAAELSLSRANLQRPPVGLDVAMCRGNTNHAYAVSQDWRSTTDMWPWMRTDEDVRSERDVLPAV